jgi:hypothetical protein
VLRQIVYAKSHPRSIITASSFCRADSAASINRKALMTFRGELQLI